MKDEMGWTYNTQFYKFQIGKLIGRMVTTEMFWQDLVAAVNKSTGLQTALKDAEFF
jgi:hypothetical protein